MRLGTSFVPFLRPRATALRPLPATLEPVCPAPAPDVDAVAWSARRADQRRAEWRLVVERVEALAREWPDDDVRVARAYADLERRGAITRACASPGMTAEGIALWWLRVGRNAATRTSRPARSSPSWQSPSGVAPA